MQHTIPGDLGDDGVQYALGHFLLHKADNVYILYPVPGIGGYFPVQAVGTQYDLICTEGLETIIQYDGFTDGYTAQCDLTGTGIQEGLYISFGLYSTAKVNVQPGFGGNTFQYIDMSEYFCFCRIQVYKVQVPDACCFKSFSDFQGILIVYFFSVIVTCGQAHTFTFDEVDCRNNSHRSKKFSSKVSPVWADFSG